MIKVECLSPDFKLTEEVSPHFGLVKEIPAGTAPQLENAVRDFMVSSHLSNDIDKEGFFQQTLQALAAASYLNQGGELWLGFLNGRLVIYLLARVGSDFDGKLSYTVSQAWVRKDQRGKKWVKQVWAKVRARAKDCMCKHFAVISSRGKTEAYCRFLGKGFHYYAEILKEEI